ncbi:MAG: efflux RND transporter periplasmic adaptor subunit [Bacteroidetes bacterium]|nr:efflux RND transporter periplasmic adaptor subunit [Bacteroidota bacterium]
MNAHQIKVSGSLTLLGLVIIVAILWLPKSGSPSEDGGEAAAEQPKGPHGGRWLESEGGFQIEATIFESGVAPEFRFYPFVDGKPVDPSRLAITASIHRLGGAVDHINFEKLDSFLQGDVGAYEPHSFEVIIEGTFDDAPVRWSYETIEGRVSMNQEVAGANGVTVDEVGSHSIQSLIDLPGEIHLNNDRLARVAPRVSGTVVEVRVGLGDRVHTGDILAVIESRELGGAISNYIESLHRLELAQSTYERERSLMEKGITARKEYEKVRHDLEEAELEKQLTEQVLLTLGLLPEQMNALGIEPEGIADGRQVRSPLQVSLTQYLIRSPIEGEIIERTLSVGQTVSGTEEAFTVADLSSVWVEIMVYARDLNKLDVGQEVTIKANSEDEVTGKGTIRFIGPLVGEGTRTAKALVTLRNDGKWRPGTFVHAIIQLGKQTVPLAIRKEAIQIWREMPVVFARFDSDFEVRPVTLGIADEGWVEVLNGLEAGQFYASNGAYLLKAELEKSGASHDH